MASLMAPMSGAFFLLLHPRDMFLYASTAVAAWVFCVYVRLPEMKSWNWRT